VVAKSDRSNTFMLPFNADVILPFAHAHIAIWSLAQSDTLFWGINQFIFIVQPYKFLSEYANPGHRCLICGKNLPPSPLRIGHVILSMYIVYKCILSGILWEISELTTQEQIVNNVAYV